MPSPLNVKLSRTYCAPKRVLRTDLRPVLNIAAVYIKRHDGVREYPTASISYAGHTAIHLKDLRKAGVFSLPPEIAYSGDAFRNAGIEPKAWVFEMNNTEFLFRKEIDRNINSLAVVSSNTGNVPLHEWELVYVKRTHRSNDLLLSRDAEVAGKPLKDREYFCVRQWKSGVVDIGPVRFNEEGRPLDPYLMVAVGGRSLIRNGQKVPVSELLQKCINDPRHVVKLPEVELADGTFMPLGLRTIQAEIREDRHEEITQKMDKGQFVFIDMEKEKACVGTLTKEKITKAMKMFGYSQEDYKYDANGNILIKLVYNSYRHSFWGTVADQMLVGFVSNDVGVNLDKTQDVGRFGRKNEATTFINPKFYQRVIKPTGLTIRELQDQLAGMHIDNAVLMGNGRDARIHAQEYTDAQSTTMADIDARSYVTGGLVSLIVNK